MKKLFFKVMWRIAGISPSMGNLVMDILGERLYVEMMMNH